MRCLVGIEQADNGGVERLAGILAAPSPDDTGYDCRVTKPRRPYVGIDETVAPESGP